MIHSLSSSFRLKCTVLGMVLRPLPQPKPHFPLTYGLDILGAVRGKQYCELVEYEVHTSTESVGLRENVTILMKFIWQHLLQGFLQEFTECQFWQSRTVEFLIKSKRIIKLSIEFRNSEAHCFFGHPQAARINRRLRCNSNLTFAHVPSIIQLKLLLCLYWCENRYCSAGHIL